MRAGCSNHIPTDAAGKLHDDATMDRLVAALATCGPEGGSGRRPDEPRWKRPRHSRLVAKRGARRTVC